MSRRCVVVGAGAVGGVVGGLLHRAGHEVTLVARGAHLSALREHGLTLDTGEGREVVRPTIAAGPAEVDWSGDDVVLLATKTHQAEAALHDLALHAPTGITIVCLTNGVRAEEMALRRFADVLGVGVMLPALHLEPGVVMTKCHPTPGVLDVGRVPAGADAGSDTGVDEVAALLRSAGFASEPREDVMAWKRRKLVHNVGNGADASFEPGPDVDALVERAEAEAEAALAASGLTLATREQDAARRAGMLVRRPDLPDGGSSTWQSLRRGSGDSEVDYLAGEVVLLGRLHGVPTPACEQIVAATRRLAASGGAPRSLPVPVLP